MGGLDRQRNRRWSQNLDAPIHIKQIDLLLRKQLEEGLGVPLSIDLTTLLMKSAPLEET
jgi:hypothetical protein